MKGIYKTSLSVLGAGVALLALVMLTPRAAHAVVATLVQVVNPQTSPVPTLDNSKSATFNVNLQCPAFPRDTPCRTQNGFGPTFTVPSGQFFVITTVETTTTRTDLSSVLSLLTQGPSGPPANIRQWILPPVNATLQFQYPTGILVGPGLQVMLEGDSGGFIYGYLTAQ